MRTITLAAAALLASGGLAAAAPASVTVSISPELQAKAAHVYGARDIDSLADDLRSTVEKRLAKTGAYDGARIELVLTDAKPTRPTFKQLGDTSGLSMRSFGLGGAEIDGQAILPGGRVTPIHYRYYETDLRQSHHGTTWSDAEGAIQQFAYHLSRGEKLAER